MRFIAATLAAVCLIGLCFLLVLTAPAPAVPPGGGVELPSSTIWRTFLADLFVTFWMLIIPLIFIACFTVAAIFGGSSGTTRSMQSPETNQSEK
jgi:hypothetical protein